MTTLTQLDRKTKIKEYIQKSVGTSRMESFADFAKRHLALNDFTGTDSIIDQVGEIFSGKVVPAGYSLNVIIGEFNTWKNSKAFKRLSSIDDDIKVEEDNSVNVTATETGGFTLKDIGNNLDNGRSLSATAINQLIDKIIPPKNGDKAKLSFFKDDLKNMVSSGEPNLAFEKEIKKASVKAAGLFVDYMELARDEETDLVSYSKLLEILKEKKLLDSHDDFSIAREKLFLDLLISWANDIEYADDEVWKDLVMDALVEDFETPPLEKEMAEMMPLDIAREHLSIMGSFQTMVALIMVPPPRRGRPPKSK